MVHAGEHSEPASYTAGPDGNFRVSCRCARVAELADADSKSGGRMWGNLRGNLRAFNFELSATIRTVYLVI
jgi:hypothetical protein